MTTLLGPDSIEEKIDQFVVDFNRSKLEIQSYIQQSRQLEGAIHAPNADPEGAFQAALGLVKMQAQGTSGSTIPSRGNIIGAEIAKRAANRANGTLSLIKGIASKLFHSDVASYNQVVCYLTLRWWYFPIDRDAIASLLMRIPYMSNDDAVGVGADHSLKYIGNGMLYASFAAALISHNLPAIRSKVGAILASRTTFSGLGGLFRSIKKFKPKLPKKSSILPAIKRVGGKASNTYQVGKTAVKLVAVKTYQKGKNVADLYKNRADYITWLKQAKIPHPRQVFQDWMKTFSEKHSTPEAKMEFRRYLKLRVREFVGKTAVSLIGMGAGGSLGYGAMLFNQTQEVNIDPKDALLWISFLGAGELATDLVELRAQTTQMRNQIPRDSKAESLRAQLGS
jgi:hypothetical protein